MRSVCTKILIVLILFSSSLVTFAGGHRPIQVFYNGTRIAFEVEPTITAGHTRVPMRKIFETLGATVTWQPATRSVVATYQNHTIELTVGRQTAFIDSRAYPLASPATIVNGRTLVPLRFIAEALGAKVVWDGERYCIYITTRTTVEQLTNPIGIDHRLADLVAAKGQAKRISKSMYGFDWHTYHNHYADFTMYGVKDGKIVAVYAKSTATLPALAIRYGDSQAAVRNHMGARLHHIIKGHTKYAYDSKKSDLFLKNNQYVHVFYDALNDNKVSAVLAIAKRQEELTAGYYGINSDTLERAFELQLFDIVNAERTLQGLVPFSLHSRLQLVSRAHSQDMIDRNFFSHTNPSGLSPHDRLTENNYDFTFSAENIACGQFSAIFAHQDFMNSASHRKAVLSQATYLATGVQFGGSYSRYYTETFYTPVK